MTLWPIPNRWVRVGQGDKAKGSRPVPTVACPGSVRLPFGPITGTADMRFPTPAGRSVHCVISGLPLTALLLRVVSRPVTVREMRHTTGSGRGRGKGP